MREIAIPFDAARVRRLNAAQAKGNPGSHAR